MKAQTDTSTAVAFRPGTSALEPRLGSSGTLSLDAQTPLRSAPMPGAPPSARWELWVSKNCIAVAWRGKCRTMGLCPPLFVLFLTSTVYHALISERAKELARAFWTISRSSLLSRGDLYAVCSRSSSHGQGNLALRSCVAAGSCRSGICNPWGGLDRVRLSTVSTLEWVGSASSSVGAFSEMLRQWATD